MIATVTVVPVFTFRIVKFERQLVGAVVVEQKGTRELPSFFQVSAGVWTDAVGMLGEEDDDRVVPEPHPPMLNPSTSDKAEIAVRATGVFTG